jgi:hypothetical protein
MAKPSARSAPLLGLVVTVWVENTTGIEEERPPSRMFCIDIELNGIFVTMVVAESLRLGVSLGSSTWLAKSLRQFAEAEQSRDAALLLGFERPSRQRRVELFGKAIDPWNHKEADEERRREGLPPVHFRRLR